MLLETIRRIGLHGTELCRAQAGTIRLKLLKIGTVIVRNTRRIRLLFSSAYPYAALLRLVLGRLSSAGARNGAAPGTKKNNGAWGQCLQTAQKSPSQASARRSTRPRGRKTRTPIKR